MLCGAAPFEYIVLDDECDLDDCDDFDTVSSVLTIYFLDTLLPYSYHVLSACLVLTMSTSTKVRSA